MIYKKYYKRNGKVFEITRIYEYNEGKKTMVIEIKEYPIKEIK